MRFGATQVHVDPGPGALVRALAHDSAAAAGRARCDRALAQAPRSRRRRQRDDRGDGAGRLETARRAVRPARRLGRRLDPAALRAALRAAPRDRRRARRPVLRSTTSKCARRSATSTPVETYGLHFRYAGTTISYLPCTRYFDGLIEDYRSHAPDVLVINVLRYADSMDVDHLTLDEAKRLIGGIRPGSAIMTHFGTKMLERDPRRLALRTRGRTRHARVRRARRARCMTPSLEIAVAKPGDADGVLANARSRVAQRSLGLQSRLARADARHDGAASTASIVGALRPRIAASLAHVERALRACRRSAAGIGRALLARCEELANYYNCHKVSVAVHNGSPALRSSKHAATTSKRFCRSTRSSSTSRWCGNSCCERREFAGSRGLGRRFARSRTGRSTISLDACRHSRACRRGRPIPAGVRRAIAADPLPRAPRDPAAVYDALPAQIAPYAVDNRHPRFFGWVHGAGTVTGMLAGAVGGRS